jgi:TolA-binding protein
VTVAPRLSIGAVTSLVFALTCSLPACGPNHGTSYAQAMAEASRAESAGRYVDAARTYDAAARAARIDRDREHAQYLAAMMSKRSGDDTAATGRLRTLASSTSKTAPIEAAEFQLAEMALTRGDASAGLLAMERFFVKHPSSGLARPALMRVLRDRDNRSNPKETLAYLRGLETILGASELGETIAYEAALRLVAIGDTRSARDAFVAVVARWPYPGGKLFDDALFRASELDEALEDYVAAVTHLQEMLRERETTTFLGSYQRPRYSLALMRIAHLYRDRLDDRVRAREALHRIYVEFTTSTLRDDALFEEAALFREDGDPKKACLALVSLVRDFPDSRYVPCAVELCPDAKRPTNSKAPVSCSAYLTAGSTDSRLTPEH